MFTLVIIVSLAIAFVCLVKRMRLIKTLLTIALVMLVISSVVTSLLACISAVLLLMYGGPMFDTFNIWLMAAGMWGLSACMLAFMNRYKEFDGTKSFVPGQVEKSRENKAINQYFLKRVKK